MIKAYNEIEESCREEMNKKYLSFATPLMWSHAEYAMALILRAERELDSV